MKAKQYAWVHLITNGKMNQRPSYYGGWDPIDKRIHSFSSKEEKNMKENFLADIKKYGVNWDKTDDVQSEMYSEFEGTFCDPSSKTYLEGWIALRNGRKEFWCAPNIDASDIFKQMEKMSEFEQKYREIFGE